MRPAKLFAFAQHHADNKRMFPGPLSGESCRSRGKRQVTFTTAPWTARPGVYAPPTRFIDPLLELCTYGYSHYWKTNRLPWLELVSSTVCLRPPLVDLVTAWTTT